MKWFNYATKTFFIALLSLWIILLLVKDVNLESSSNDIIHDVHLAYNIVILATEMKSKVKVATT